MVKTNRGDTVVKLMLEKERIEHITNFSDTLDLCIHENLKNDVDVGAGITKGRVSEETEHSLPSKQ